MRKYSDYKTPEGNSKRHHADELTPEEFEKIKWLKYKIIVPTEEDRQELMDAFEHFHDEGYDSDIIAANQLAHEYLNMERNESQNNILVDPELYEKLKDKYTD